MRLVFLVIVASIALAQKPAKSIKQDILAVHNAGRKQVGTPLLVWSDALAKVAQQWANTLLKNGKFEHRPNPKFGENLFEIRGGNATPAQVVSDWVGERKDYDAAAAKCKSGAVCGHFTQVVSKLSQRVGCAVARDGTRREVWVCNYDPPGNFVGERPF
jgi:hypothetical protein